MKAMEVNHHDNSPVGFVLTLCFLSISLMIKMLEINLPKVDEYLIVIVHLSQLVAAIVAITVGYFTFKNLRNKKHNNDSV